MFKPGDLRELAHWLRKLEPEPIAEGEVRLARDLDRVAAMIDADNKRIDEMFRVKDYTQAP